MTKLDADVRLLAGSGHRVRRDVAAGHWATQTGEFGGGRVESDPYVTHAPAGSSGRQARCLCISQQAGRGDLRS